MWDKLVGGIVAALVYFFGTKAGTLLGGLGLTFIAVKGGQVFLGYVITDMQAAISFAQNSSYTLGGTALGRIMLQMIAYSGVFDAINIIISGLMTHVSLLSLKWMLGRL